VADKRTPQIPRRATVKREPVGTPTHSTRTVRPLLTPDRSSLTPSAPVTREKVGTRARTAPLVPVVESSRTLVRPHAVVTERNRGGTGVSVPRGERVFSPKTTAPLRPSTLTSVTGNERNVPATTNRVQTVGRMIRPHAIVERPASRSPVRPSSTTIGVSPGGRGGGQTASVSPYGYGSPVPRKVANRPPLRVSEL